MSPRFKRKTSCVTCPKAGDVGWGYVFFVGERGLGWSWETKDDHENLRENVWCHQPNQARDIAPKWMRILLDGNQWVGCMVSFFFAAIVLTWGLDTFWSIWSHIYIYVYIYMYIYIYTYVHIHTYTYIHTHTYIHIHMWVMSMVRLNFRWVNQSKDTQDADLVNLSRCERIGQGLFGMNQRWSFCGGNPRFR